MRLYLLSLILCFGVSVYADTLKSVELSESEKLIFENRKNITRLNLKVENLKESIDGIKSLLDSINQKNTATFKSNNLKNRVDNLEKRLNELEKENKKRFLKIEKSIQKIINLLSNKKKSENKKEKITKSKKIKILPIKTIYKKAKSSFKAKRYKESRDYFLDLVDKNFKLAESYFYIAETLFFQKRYKDAIYYYKKSVYKDDNSVFMPRLLLHTGISFKNIGDKSGAKKFFESLLGAYPNSNEAKEAKSYLKKL